MLRSDIIILLNRSSGFCFSLSQMLPQIFKDSLKNNKVSEILHSLVLQSKDKLTDTTFSEQEDSITEVVFNPLDVHSLSSVVKDQPETCHQIPPHNYSKFVRNLSLFLQTGLRINRNSQTLEKLLNTLNFHYQLFGKPSLFHTLRRHLAPTDL